MTADLMWRCTVCGNEYPRSGFANARTTILRCPECGLTRHEPRSITREDIERMSPLKNTIVNTSGL